MSRYKPAFIAQYWKMGSDTMGFSWWRTVVTLGIFLGLVIFGLEVVVAGYNQFILPPEPLHLGQVMKDVVEYLQQPWLDRYLNLMRELIMTYEERLRF
ncbi:hypothetical protein [Desulfofundulus salinus]|uniref:Uncharacterized protein n=1 Tax=Desulfofundulus salinus TaxID=2419843 RepID=A0A494WVJ5_9FIRM|nr:hypothetical protein [Desulfofundulus salinum]RKO66212.1 hypothetical protein D7024_04145 [Desulfofundulus salinum]